MYETIDIQMLLICDVMIYRMDVPMDTTQSMTSIIAFHCHCQKAQKNAAKQPVKQNKYDHVTGVM